MAQVERKQEDTKDGKRAKAVKGRAARRGKEQAMLFSSLDAGATLAMVFAFAETGGAIRLGLTRDKGAVAVGVYYGADYATEYVRPTEDWYEACREIVDAWVGDPVTNFDVRYEQLTGRRQQ